MPVVLIPDFFLFGRLGVQDVFRQTADKGPQAQRLLLFRLSDRTQSGQPEEKTLY